MNSWTSAPLLAAPNAPEQRGVAALRPAWALLGTTLGTICAVLLVPASGYYLPGALVPSVAVLAAGLLLGPALASLRSPLTAFRIEHLLMFGLVYWILLDPLQSATRLWDVSQETVQATFFYTGLFAACLWLGSTLASLFWRSRTAGVIPQRDVGRRFLFAAGVLCVVLGFAQATVTCDFSAGCLADALFAPRFAVPWLGGGGVRGLNTLLLNLRYFGYLVLPLWVALALVERRASWRVLVLAPLALAFLLLLIRDGGRKELGTVVGAGMLVWVLLQARLQPRHYAAVLAGGAGLLMVMQVMLAWRDIGVSKVFGADPLEQPRAYRGIPVDWGYDWMAHVMEVVPERSPHTGSDGLLYVVGYQIPQRIWTSKPVHRGIDLPRLIGRRYGPGFSWNCTAVGDLYLIGGALAVALGGLFYGALANRVSRMLLQPATVRSRLLYAVIAMALFLTLRALWEFTAQGVTVLAVWALLALHGLVWRPRSVP